MSNKIVKKLIQEIRSAAVYNSDAQVAPTCILWPDKEKQWEPVIQTLQKKMEELLIFGDYKPESKTGPAIWLRCLLADRVDKVKISEDKTPIIYLPGISRQDLRVHDDFPVDLKPLAELQFRGVFWSQISFKDWTILAFLKSKQGGLGLKVASDNKAKSSMQLALPQLLDEDLKYLKNKHLDRDYFNTLLAGGDPVKDLLTWLNNEEEFKNSRGDNEWKAFAEVCKSQFVFDPVNGGILTGAQNLAEHEGPWKSVWERFCESPNRYKNIPKIIRQCPMPLTDLFSNADSHGSWPQWNDAKEDELKKEFFKINQLPLHKARDKVIELVKGHEERAKLIWTEFGESNIISAGLFLKEVALLTKQSLAAGTLSDLQDGYTSWGWKVDDYVLKALSCVKNNDEYEAVSTVIRSIYLEWLDSSALHLQDITKSTDYPGNKRKGNYSRQSSGECILFVDGLRFDTAKRAVGILNKKGIKCLENVVWSALPSVTATGKPAVSPVEHLISGKENKSDFEPCVSETGSTLAGGYQLSKLLKDNDWNIIAKNETNNPGNNSWCEFGDIDHEGHNRGYKLAKHIDSILEEIVSHIENLLDAGWERIRVVTDHGWLLMPGGLEKVELPAVLTESKWGRCASLKKGTNSDELMYPWYWNSSQHFALAPGVRCYKKGQEYTHGGLSLQECLNMEITIINSSGKKQNLLEITDFSWKGLRCKIAVEGTLDNYSFDIRKQPGNSDTSIVMSIKKIKEDGTSSVVIEDEDLIGTEAFIVILNSERKLVAQKEVKVGGE